MQEHEGGNCSVFSVFSGAKFIQPTQSKLNLYGLAGLGLCFQSTSDFTVRGAGPGYSYTTTTYNQFRSGTKFGILAGGGIEYELSKKLALFLEPRFINIFGGKGKLPEDWDWLEPEDYENPPSVLFFSIRIGLNFRI